MRITNLSGGRVLCITDKERITLNNQHSVEVENPEVIRFLHESKSYCLDECRDSKFLKILSFFDDPFRLSKEYYLVVDMEIINNQFCDSKQLTLTSNITYADVKTRIYYEYFDVDIDGKRIFPDRVVISGINGILEDFTKNSKKLTFWNAVWNVFVEPVVFELVGYFVIYQLFMLWIGTAAWHAVLLLITLNILIEAVILICKIRINREKYFQQYLVENTIRGNCYNNT